MVLRSSFPKSFSRKSGYGCFRENSEDIYAGIEWEAESSGAKKIIKYLQDEMKVNQIRYTDECGIGIKPVSRKGGLRD